MYPKLSFIFSFCLQCSLLQKLLNYTSNLQAAKFGFHPDKFSITIGMRTTPLYRRLSLSLTS